MTGISKASDINLAEAIQSESRKFQEYYLWLKRSMPSLFFEETSEENIMLIVHNLMGFNLQAYFSIIHLKHAALVMCLESADADLRILQHYAFFGIKNYQAYVSTSPPPFPGITANLRIASIVFTTATEANEPPFAPQERDLLFAALASHHSDMPKEDLEHLISSVNVRFLRSLPKDRLIMVLEMLLRAQTRDNCQYEVRYNEAWEEEGSPSMLIVFAWRNTPKHNFLFRLARIIFRHHLVMQRVHASYINTYSKESILIMSLELHGNNGQAAWESAEIIDFLREFLTVKYFIGGDAIENLLVNKGHISGSMGNFLRSAIFFIHQSLVHVDVNLYTLENIEEALCRHPELTARLCEAFVLKFDPDFFHYDEYLKVREKFLADTGKLDTGQEENDQRRKSVLRQGMNFIHYMLKTNFFRPNLTAHSFRLDPRYLDEIPFDRSKKFPELPYAIFFIRGMHFFGFHIRFKDLARGGLRTVYPSHPEQIKAESNNIFTECYQLAYTQHLKNKDIPEAGAKGIIFLYPYERLESESLIFQKELAANLIEDTEISKQVELFRQEQRIEYLHQAQRSFVESLLTIINCSPDGRIKAKNIIDYWKRPEYLYLGPDENMHDEMIQWIADFSQKYGYKPGGAFISGKPQTGINHKHYGVTSLGVNVYMEELLRYMGIDPAKDSFTIKMSGGPDGDVAGNEIYNLYRYYPKTAKLLTLIDMSGTIYDPQGLDLGILATLFKEGKPISHYPPERLSDGGLLLDKFTKRSQNALAQQTLCWHMRNGYLEKEWLSGSEMNHLLRTTVHQTKAHIFIPAGGRPRTLNEDNIKEFLDENGKPTSLGIVEGANLYFSPKARRQLEKLGVLIIKDSSANKTGVICSSFEVLCGLALTDEQFLQHKEQLVSEILDRLKQCAAQEAHLLLHTHQLTKEFLTDISQQISEKINEFTYQLLDYLDPLPWNDDLKDPLTRCFMDYCLPTLRTQFLQQTLSEIPDHHKKAVVSCHLAAQVVYRKGLSWQPTIVDILPVLLSMLGEGLETQHS